MTISRASRLAPSLLGVWALVASSAAYAHHTFAMFDNEKQITLPDGKVFANGGPAGPANIQ